ncbi:hypothetical protein ACSSS7_003995 [Eimeria intestinalis]
MESAEARFSWLGRYLPFRSRPATAEVLEQPEAEPTGSSVVDKKDTTQPSEKPKEDPEETTEKPEVESTGARSSWLGRYLPFLQRPATTEVPDEPTEEPTGISGVDKRDTSGSPETPEEGPEETSETPKRPRPAWLVLLYLFRAFSMKLSQWGSEYFEEKFITQTAPGIPFWTCDGEAETKAMLHCRHGVGEHVLEARLHSAIFPPPPSPVVSRLQDKVGFAAAVTVAAAHLSADFAAALAAVTPVAGAGAAEVTVH